jgi:hypothetical protein
MNIFGSHDHQTIALSSLNGFAEDSEAAKLFERRFRSFTLSGIATAFIGFGVFIYFAVREGDGAALLTVFTLLALTSFLIGFILIFVGSRRMREAIPISPQSGQPMEIYRLEDTIKGGKCELIYVCRKSRTYFRRVFTESGGT